jgi:hypothetical protein
MIQSKLRPIVVRLNKMRFRYAWQEMETGILYTVIAYDMKRLLVTAPKADRAYYMLWKDAELIKSELIASQSNPSLNSNDIQALRKTISKVGASIPRPVKKK